MNPIRYEDLRIDRVLLKEFQAQLETDFKRIQGHNDTELLLKEFEKIFAAYIGTKSALALNSGSDALQLSLLSGGIKKGDEVILPSVTYPAVPLSVIYAGARPVFVDISSEDLQMDTDAVAAAVTAKTKAILCPHMFARPCAIEEIVALARRSNLLVIEDCCQAESSEHKGKKLGSFADLSCFSFSYYKPLSSSGGGGGMVCFNDPAYQKIRDYTRVWQDDDALLEISRRFARMYLLDLIAIKTKMKYLDKIVQSRVMLRRLYEEGLSGIKGLTIFADKKGDRSVPQNFVVLSRQRDALGEFLYKNGIIWQKPYGPVHAAAIFKKYSRGKFPVSERYGKEALHLPLFSFMKQEECLRVVKTVREFHDKASLK
ncbi:MAG: aminotransferase class I/II-fold pyridoxal phosphate-dependent enzyme [Candidatus Omnitrophota bacterium]